MSEKVQSYKDLVVWRKAIALVEQSYLCVARFPRDEVYGLASQIRRAAVSIAANIAEGYGRDQTGSFLQFLKIPQGSTRELETHFIIAERIKYIDSETSSVMANHCEEISKMLRALIRSIEAGRDGGG